MNNHHRLYAFFGVILLCIGLLPASTVQAVPPRTVELVSIANDGTQANLNSGIGVLSADGSIVAFTSPAWNLIPGDNNSKSDIFVYDRGTDTLERISEVGGVGGNNNSYRPAISGDGRYVVFDSASSNFVLNDTNSNDVFLHDRDDGSISLISVAHDGEQANGFSDQATISADGRYVAYVSGANNLVPDDTNGEYDCFVYDRNTGAVERVSVASDGTEGNMGCGSASISANGRYVTFISWADNLVPDDTNGMNDVFVYDRDTDTLELVSKANDGTQTNNVSLYAHLSADGRYVVFRSNANNLVPMDTNGYQDIFVYDRDTDTIERVSLAPDGSEANGHSDWPAISADGRFVAFDSYADNLVPDDTYARDIFVYDRLTDEAERISVNPDGSQANDNSDYPAISANGLSVVFVSHAPNLVPNDTNAKADLFVADRTLVVDDAYTTAYETQLAVSAPGVLANDVATAVIADTGSTSEGGTYSINADGSFTYDPPVGFFNGDDSFAYSGTEDGATQSATVVITVPNDAPVAIDDAYSVFMDTQLVEAAPGVLANDTDVQGTILTATPLAAVPTTQNGTVTLNADGGFTYDPPVGYTGTDTFTYTISDGLASDDGLVTLNVIDPAGTPPRLYPRHEQVLIDADNAAWPRFTFRHQNGVEWYQVWIGTDDYTMTALNQWYEASQICDAGNCTLPIDLWLTNGNYAWWMTYWNETRFSVSFNGPGAFTLTSPADGATVNAAPATIEWARDTNVLWYQIWVGPDTYATSQYFGWVDATEICDATTCSIDVSDQTFADGGYEVWAEMWGPGGYVGWTAVNGGAAAATFTVATGP